MWNLIWILSGYLLGSNWTVVESRLSAILLKFNTAVVVVLAVFILFAVWRHRRGRKKME
jgi:membrane protein DedA with SNARE-associated domain